MTFSRAKHLEEVKVGKTHHISAVRVADIVSGPRSGHGRHCCLVPGARSRCPFLAPRRKQSNKSDKQQMQPEARYKNENRRDAHINTKYIAREKNNPLPRGS